MGTILIKKPKDCSVKELLDFADLVIRGSQVDQTGLDKRIGSCRYLAFYYQGESLVAISALKTKQPKSVNKTLNKAKAQTSSLPVIELGYSVTEEIFRGQGINKILNDQLLQLVLNEKVYATTGNPVMKKYLLTKGFIQRGESYKGKHNAVLEYFEKDPMSSKEQQDLIPLKRSDLYEPKF